MTELIVGDDLLDTTKPARVLVVGGSPNVSTVQEAVASLPDLFKIDACSTLYDAIAEARANAYDVTVLALSLPDSWPADTCYRFSEADQRSQMLLVADTPDDAATIRHPKRPAFCILLKSALDPVLVRRMLISACLYKRAADVSPGAVIAAQEAR